MSIALLHLVLLATTGPASPSTREAAPVAARACEISVRAQNKLGNFEIQDLMVRVDQKQVDGRDYPAEAYTIKLRVAPNGEGRAAVAIVSPCTVTRAFSITARAKSLVNNEVVDVKGITAMDDWEEVKIVKVRFQR